MAALDEYTWIFVLSLIFAFGTAVGIGANDLANSFATTVGSRALTIGQVVILASICEFAGAVLLGAGVTSTIKSGVAQLSVLATTPTVLMYGFMCVSATAALIDNTASRFGAPISMTHTTVGAVVGMALSLQGGSAVIWSRELDEFPYIGGMTAIFLSWVISPLMCAIITSVLFLAIRFFILRSSNPFQRAFYALPVLVGGMAWLITAFVIQTGSKNETWKDYEDTFAVWVGAVIGAAFCLFTLCVVMPILRKQIRAAEEMQAKLSSEAEKKHAHLEEHGKGGVEYVPGFEKPASFLDKLSARMPSALKHNSVFLMLTSNITKDIHSVQEHDERIIAVRENAEKFDVRTEAMFRYLQVFSAAVMSFTHGANDVSNAMGPFSAVYTIWQDGNISSSVNVETWILVIGGVGISVGLTFFSARVIQTLGVKAVHLSNSRGFCAELATAITVAIASRYGLPISTTQTITGGLFALGLMEGHKGLNKLVFVKIVVGWVCALFLACGVSAGLTAWGAYSPNLNSEEDKLDNGVP